MQDLWRESGIGGMSCGLGGRSSAALRPSAPPRRPQGGIQPVDIRLHLLATAFVHDLASHDGSGVRAPVASRRQLAFDAVDAGAEHHLYPIGTLAEDDDFQDLVTVRCSN